MPRNSPYLPEAVRIEKIRSLTEREKLFSIVLGSPRALLPGQFLMIGAPGMGEAPISIASPPSQAPVIELCVRAAGSVTNALHKLKNGDTVWIRGPFGKGFDVKLFKGKDLLFIAGGIGLAPMRSLIKAVLGERKSFGKLTLLYGVKTPEELLFKDELKKWKKTIDVRITIDKPRLKNGGNGWKGNIGVVTTLIPPLTIDKNKSTAVLIGPPVMYRFVILSLGEKGLGGGDIFVSLERKMKCGIGKCGHCQINNLYACQEGPVFNLNEITNLCEAF